MFHRSLSWRATDEATTNYRNFYMNRYSVNKEIAHKEKYRILSKFILEKDTGCWNWNGFIDYNGYGKVTYHRMTMGAHRLSYMLFVGDIEKGFDVCHKCDNRKCVNPDHLFLGTRKDNVHDSMSKGRQARGFSLPQTKLSVDDVKSIVNLAKTGDKYENIAKMFNIHRAYVGMLARQNGIYRYNRNQSR